MKRREQGALKTGPWGQKAEAHSKRENQAIRKQGARPPRAWDWDPEHRARAREPPSATVCECGDVCEWVRCGALGWCAAGAAVLEGGSKRGAFRLV